MSKTKLGQKSLGLTARLFLGTGLVLSLTHSLDEEGIAGKSLAELRQEAWTQEVFSGNLLELRGSDFDFPGSGATTDDDRARFVAADFEVSPKAANTQAFVQIAEVNKPEQQGSMPIASQNQIIAEAENSLSVNSSAKKDRRLGWGWEPYAVSHGRRKIALNWSGSIWSMDGPFSDQSNLALPKIAFAPSDDLELVMADASQFLQPDPISQVPDSMLAQNSPATQSPSSTQDQDTLITGSTALAYAQTSVEALEEPFKAILTEQNSGQISEGNQVTILGAVEDLNRTLSGETSENKKTSAPETKVQKIAALTPITELPRPRAAFTAQQTTQQQAAKVSQPLDVSPVVANLQAAEAKKELEQSAAIAEENDASAKHEGLTLAKSKERRAKLQLASLSGEREETSKKKSRFASWFSFGSSDKAQKAKIDAKGEHAWVTNKLPKSSYTKKQRTCLANAIYFEARSEPESGQIAVAQVVANRVKNPTYPNSLCGVVYQNQHKRNACQFSFACDRIPDRIRSKKAWDLAWKYANQVIDGEVWLKSVGSSTHYHATYVRPKWARTMKKRKKIGLHIFYKTYGGGWS
uniref:cell wall hydrolase n=1 Tax=Cohaesibacter celericrescens TaxID=2067669 RepID=UPI003566CFA6